MDTSGVIGNLLLLVLLILINAFFAMSEIAIISINSNKMRKLSEEGNKKARLLLKITDSPSDFLATIQVGVTLSGFFASAVAADKFTSILVEQLAFLPISPNVLGTIILVVITLLLSYFTLVFGELVPKRIAMRYADSMSLRVVGIVNAVAVVCKPFVRFLAASTNLVLKLFGISAKEEQEQVSEEEILMMLEAGEERGVFEPEENDMIRNVFAFDDRRVSEIMTHRTDITALEEDEPIQEVINIALQEGYSRIPIYRETIDDIVGIVYVKDLLRYVEDDAPEDIALKDLMRRPMFVPGAKKCTQLLKEFKAQKTHMAIVVDEYGGTDGLITMEDLVEDIVGDIEDEYDDEPEEITALPDGAYVFDGTVPIDDVSETLDSDVFEGEDYETLGGLIVDRLGRIPGPGEQVTLQVGDYVLTVLENDGRKVTKVGIHKKAPTPEPEPDAKGKEQK
ncbi:MAG: hemolysin family protein [Christensenellales bacterium]|jgi:putative hemolysin